jgi:hypothetical protein
MKTGTKSILFGVHAFWWHPITVYMGWCALYNKRPNLSETVAIFFHDLGYWGSDNMDDAYGEQHPIRSAMLLEKLFGPRRSVDARLEVLYHSRYLCARHDVEPSKLCWADKLSMVFDPKWFYILRARLSGEIQEYKANAANKVRPNCTDSEWFDWVRVHCKQVAVQHTPGQTRMLSGNPPRVFTPLASS